MEDPFGNLLVALATLLLTWVVGTRIAAFWTLRQKRKELDLVAAERFYSLYGEFFAVWKLWNYLLEAKYKDGKEDKKRRVSLLERAAAMEAGMEALLFKISSERKLSKNEKDDLGLLRQGFQALRVSMREVKKLPWYSSEYPQYQKLKRTASRVGNMLASSSWAKEPSAAEAELTFRYITSNIHEERWELS